MDGDLAPTGPRARRLTYSSPKPLALFSMMIVYMSVLSQIYQTFLEWLDELDEYHLTMG